MIDTGQAAQDAVSRRFTERVTIYESAEMLDLLREHSSRWGRSTGAEISPHVPSLLILPVVSDAPVTRHLNLWSSRPVRMTRATRCAIAPDVVTYSM
jgi:hypothetical protein